MGHIKSKLGATVRMYQFLHRRSQALKIYYCYSIHLSKYIKPTMHFFALLLFLVPLAHAAPYPTYTCTQEITNTSAIAVSSTLLTISTRTSAIAVTSTLVLSTLTPTPTPTPIASLPAPTAGVSPSSYASSHPPTNRLRSTSAPSQTSPAHAHTTSPPPPPRPPPASNSTAQRRPSGPIRALSAPSLRTYTYLLALRGSILEGGGDDVNTATGMHFATAC
jgi:hypothetical protein